MDDLIRAATISEMTSLHWFLECAVEKQHFHAAKFRECGKLHNTNFNTYSCKCIQRLTVFSVYHSISRDDSTIWRWESFRSVSDHLLGFGGVTVTPHCHAAASPDKSLPAGCRGAIRLTTRVCRGPIHCHVAEARRPRQTTVAAAVQTPLREATWHNHWPSRINHC